MNADGLTPGQTVDFETLQRIKATQRSRKHADPEPEQAKRGRKAKVHATDKPEPEDTPVAVGEKEA